MIQDRKNKPCKMGFLKSFAIYIPASIVMFLSTRYLIPFLTRITGIETIIYWFLVAGILIFLPLIILSYTILKAEGYKINHEMFVKRLRFKKLELKDIYWSIAGLIVVSMLSVLLMKVTTLFIGKFDSSPPFMTFEPLSSGRFWILALWFPYWLLNILGEEIMWRGVMLTRQEIAFGKNAWIIHGFGWAIFHIAFGWQLLFLFIPLLFILPFIVQKTKNSWVGVIMHAGINGPSFIAIALGLL